MEYGEVRNKIITETMKEALQFGLIFSGTIVGGLLVIFFLTYMVGWAGFLVGLAIAAPIGGSILFGYGEAMKRWSHEKAKLDFQKDRQAGHVGRR